MRVAAATCTVRRVPPRPRPWTRDFLRSLATSPRLNCRAQRASTASWASRVCAPGATMARPLRPQTRSVTARVLRATTVSRVLPRPSSTFAVTRACTAPARRRFPCPCLLGTTVQGPGLARMMARRARRSCSACKARTAWAVCRSTAACACMAAPWGSRRRRVLACARMGTCAPPPPLQRRRWTARAASTALQVTRRRARLALFRRS